MKRTNSKERERGRKKHEPKPADPASSKSPTSSRPVTPNPYTAPAPGIKLIQDLEEAASQHNRPKSKSRSRSPKSRSRVLVTEEPETSRPDTPNGEADLSNPPEPPKLKIKDHEWKIGLKLEPEPDKKHGPTSSDGTHTRESYLPAANLQAPEVVGSHPSQPHFYLDPPYAPKEPLPGPSFAKSEDLHLHKTPAKAKAVAHSPTDAELVEELKNTDIPKQLLEAEEEIKKEKIRQRSQSPHDYHTSDDTVKKHYLLSLMPTPGTIVHPKVTPPASPRVRPSKSPMKTPQSPQKKLKEDIPFHTRSQVQPKSKPITPPAKVTASQVGKPRPATQKPFTPRIPEILITSAEPSKIPSRSSSTRSIVSQKRQPEPEPKKEGAIILPPSRESSAGSLSVEGYEEPEREPSVESVEESQPQVPTVVDFNERVPPKKPAEIKEPITPLPIEPSTGTVTESQATLASVAGPKLFGAKIGEFFAPVHVGRKPGAPAEPELKYEHPKVPDTRPSVGQILRKLTAPEESEIFPSFAPSVATQPPAPEVPAPKPELHVDLKEPEPVIPEIVIEPPTTEEPQEVKPGTPEKEKPKEKYSLAKFIPELQKPKSEEHLPKPEDEKGGFWTLFKKPKSKEIIPKSPSESNLPELELKRPKLPLKKSKTEPDLVKAVKARKTMEVANKFRKDREQLRQMGDCGIPDQKHLLDVLLDSDPKIFDFGGFLREYFSPSLRVFAPFNVQGRYRGTENTDCLTAIDVQKMSSKEDVEAKAKARNLAKREQVLEGLRAAAKDEEHFQFLKGFANMQQLTFPVTVCHEMLQETVPMLDEIFHFYLDSLGQDHKCTIEAGEHFVRHRNRLNMYDNL